MKEEEGREGEGGRERREKGGESEGGGREGRRGRERREGWREGKRYMGRREGERERRTGRTYNIKKELRSGKGCDNFIGDISEFHHVHKSVVVVGKAGHYILLETTDCCQMALILREDNN